MFHQLTIKQLASFYWSARLGSFSAAATRLNTTQPSISTRIADMERALGVLLFDRRGRAARLTEKGQDLIGPVEQMIALGDALDALSGRQEAVAGVVRLGVADTIALTWLPRLLGDLAQRHPAVDIELIVDMSVNLRLRLRAGELDVAFLVGAIEEPEFANRPLGQVAQSWMAHPRLGLGGAPLDAAGLAGQRIFVHSRGSDHWRAVQHWFAGEGARPPRLNGCNSLATMIGLVADGLGLAVLPHDVLRPDIAAGRLEVVATTRPVAPFAFTATWPHLPPRRAVAAVVDRAVEVAAADAAFLPPGA